MLKFMKDNPTIAFGMGLPLLVVIILSLAAVVPSWLEALPQYPVLYATDYYVGKDRGVVVNVENKKVQVSYIPSCYTEGTKLYLYTPTTGNLHEIRLDIPQHARETNSVDCQKKQPSIPIATPELEQLEVDASDTSPDGYALQNGSYESGGLMMGLFFSRGYGNSPVLHKGSRMIRLPQPDGAYSYGNAKLIGWVMPSR